MGIFTHESEYKSAISATRLFKASVLDADNLIQKVAPQAIKSVETLEGDGGPGTIKKFTFGEGGQCNYIIDSLNEASFTYCHTMTGFEGDALAHKIEKIESETKLLASGDGGCTVKNVSRYHVVGDVAILKEHVEAGKEKALGLFKLVEEYLKNNPESYN